MAEVAGDAVKVRILVNGKSIVYKASRVSWEDVVGVGNIGNSEVEGYELGLPVKNRLNITVSNASYDASLNAFQAPLNIRANSQISLVVYPAGLDEAPIISVVFLIESTSGEHDANSSEGLAPITFRGRSQGVYQLPGD